jgi:hypothetical protein
VPPSGYYLEGPVIAAVALVVIVLICRWVFTPNRPVPPPVEGPVDYGLLVPVAVVRTREDALMLRSVLQSAGIKGTVADADGGFAVLVFTDDAKRARELVRT